MAEAGESDAGRAVQLSITDGGRRHSDFLCENEP